MKTTIKQTGKWLVSCTLLLISLAFNNAQTEEKQGTWLYLSGDKPIQYRYIKVKEEDGKVYFKMQIKYDKTSSTYCQRCPGYTIFISRRVDDPNDSYKLYYKFYKTDNEVTLDHLFKVSKYREDGNWISYWDEDQAMPMVKNKAGGNPERLAFITWCIDSFNDDGIEEFNRCRRDFQGMEPTVIKE